jgi:hypothetical protein
MRLPIFITGAVLANSCLSAPANRSLVSGELPITRNIKTREVSGKRGVLYGKGISLLSFNKPGSQITWTYNWNSNTHENQNASFPFEHPREFEYVPMLHSLDPDRTGRWIAEAEAVLATGGKHLLYVNEPDQLDGGGTDTHPQEVADGYMAHMMPFKGRAQLGAPAVTNGGAGEGTFGNKGIAYLEDFLNRCHDCEFDFLPYHYYGSAEGLKIHTRAVRDMAMKYPQIKKNGNGQPDLWLTEFAPFNDPQRIDPDAIMGFLEEVMPWLDEQEYVERYSYWWAWPGSLLSLGTVDELNLAGKVYAGF